MLRESAKTLENILIENGYMYIENLNGKDFQSLYKEVHCIFEPRTYMKNLKIAQIIIPSEKKMINNEFEVFSNTFFNIIREVDLTCCGVSFNGKLRENCKDAILHCIVGVVEELQQNQMYHINRTTSRIYKLESRGWESINNMSNSKKEKYEKYSKIFNRCRKLNAL